MAQNDNAVVTAAKGYIFTAPADTVAPTVAEVEAFDPATGITGWVSVGHTSSDNMPAFAYTGGDATTKGTWQNASLKTIIAPTVDSVTFNLSQMDENAFELYYGQDNGSTDAGVFRVTGDASSPTPKALLIIIVDGDVAIGFWAPKATISRADSISLAVDAFSELPVQATFNQSTDSNGHVVYEWLSSDTGAGTGTDSDSG